ncbi:MAG: ankyrin repeat domain-containing protein [Thermodesulfobacteriota bacterium]
MNCATRLAVVLAIALPIMLWGSLAVVAAPAGSEGTPVIPGTAPVTGPPTMTYRQTTDVQWLRDEFMSAAAAGDTRRVEELLQQGVSVRIRNQLGETPLMLAALYGHEQMVRLLVERGADINAVNSEGISVLSSAVHSGKPGIVKLLLGHGATDKEGRALALARQSGNQEMVRLVSSMGTQGLWGSQSAGALQATVTKIDRPEGCLRIRSGPSTITQKIGCASMGDNLVLSGVVQKGWAQVEFPVKGWVFGSQVSSPGLFPAKAATAGSGYSAEDYVDLERWYGRFDDDSKSERRESSSMYDTSPGYYGYGTPGPGIVVTRPFAPPPPPPLPIQVGPVRIGF